ncbi:hypothetical protein OXPF_12760 [Oxobacter pfennigii]|uniref:Alternate signal-mediated exported protein, CPF_0494 family n=1 Tax=Oxobacter pfennigii TaxID=36849 RepID=A0A0P8W920_9CLOT|nr:TasA family protein [Oxobacter pfennigii]KPU45149.1 hypothetical protein OXPF_12760 [Oxobacter pfennigii]
MKKRILLGLILIGSIALGFRIGSYAWFSSTETSAGNVITAGTLSVSTDGSTVLENEENRINFNIANMQPGDVTEEFKVIVKNTGTLPAAIFGRFTMSPEPEDSSYHLFKDYEFYDYKVEYFKDGGEEVLRWEHRDDDNDPYYGTAINQDCFIRGGQAEKFEAAGGTKDLYNWITGKGPLDFMTNGDSWDMEGVGAKGYYEISFRIKYKDTATEQGQSASLGYIVKATQINQAALNDFEEALELPDGALAGQEDYLKDSAELYR